MSNFFFAPLKNTAHQLIPTNYYSISWRPLQLCKNPNLKIEEAIGLTGSSLNYKAMWQRVNRRKMKEGTAHEKSPPTAIVAAHTSPISDISATSSSTTSTKSKIINGRIIRAKRKNVMRTSLESAPRWMDRKSAESALIKRPRRTSKQANHDRFEEKAVKEYHASRIKTHLKEHLKNCTTTITA